MGKNSTPTNNKNKNRFGTEHEKLAYYVESGKRLEYKTIAALLSQLCARFGWEPIVEAGEIIGATFEGQSVTLEPGGQLELSGAPVNTLHKTCAEVSSHLYQVKAISEELGVKFLGLGFDPKWCVLIFFSSGFSFLKKKKLQTTHFSFPPFPSFSLSLFLLLQNQQVHR